MEQRPEQTQEITAEQLSELLQIRRDKLAALVAEGKDPFAVIRYDQDTHSADIQADFDAYENKEVSIAGRMMSKRIMGKASFAHVLSPSGPCPRSSTGSRTRSFATGSGTWTCS